MLLFTFAHRAEAEAFLDRGRWCVDKDPDFINSYRSESTHILVTGEGRQNATEALAAFLARSGRVSEVVNFGVAGSLVANLQIGEVVPVRTAYGESSRLKPEFRSFLTSSEEARLDCVSASARVTSLDHAGSLAPFAHIVDRELWAIGSVCSRFQIPFRSIKVVSDLAGEGDCELTRQASRGFSEALYRHWHRHCFDSSVSRNSNPVAVVCPEGFYLTTSQHQQFSMLIRALAVKEQSATGLGSYVEKLAHELQWSALLALPQSRKQKANRLLDSLRERLDPILSQVERKLAIATLPLRQAAWTCQYPDRFEGSHIEIRARISRDSDIDDLATGLSRFELKKYQDVLLGRDLDV